MRSFVLAAALLLVPSLASAQITMYRPNAYGGTLYQFGRRPSITTTITNGNGGFTQYHYGPGRAPQFVQPLPTYNYAPPVYYQPTPVYRPWGFGYRMGAW